jgi:hypothetical protein
MKSTLRTPKSPRNFTRAVIRVISGDRSTKWVKGSLCKNPTAAIGPVDMVLPLI